MASESADYRAHAQDDAWLRDWGHLLRVARQVAGLSLTALSARTGLSKGYLSKLESGHPNARNPSRATLAALARALPSFRTLAHMLDPDVRPGALAETPPTVPEFVLHPPEGTLAESRVVVGWRELETLVALLALEHSAAAYPITAVVLARAVDRDAESTRHVLERLAAMDVVLAAPPTAPGRAVSYRLAEHAEALLGVGRLGDALILAGALLSRPTLPAPRNNADTDFE